jgi:hypothetical protein
MEDRFIINNYLRLIFDAQNSGKITYLEKDLFHFRNFIEISQTINHFR